MSEDIRARLAAIEAKRAAMDPADRAALEEREKVAQRESWIRGMAPCEHGDPDWETCGQCRDARLVKKEPPMTNKDGISVEGVAGLIADLRRGQWDHVVVQGPNPTSFSTADCPQPKQAADLIEAQERAYLALSERTVADAKRIAEVMAEGDGHWSACTGCQESVDGCVSTTDYPYSAAFKCQPGGGCGECGGIGVLWTESGYYDGYAEFVTEEVTKDEKIASLSERVGVLEALCRQVQPLVCREICPHGTEQNWPHDPICAALSHKGMDHG